MAVTDWKSSLFEHLPGLALHHGAEVGATEVGAGHVRGGGAQQPRQRLLVQVHVDEVSHDVEATRPTLGN